MPKGGVRKYIAKWRAGSVAWSRKGAAHQYRNLRHRGTTYKVHQLLCEAFHGPAPTGLDYVLHRNEDALDNRPSNLFWGNQKQNLNAPGFLKYCRSRTGAHNPYRKGKGLR